MAAKGRSKPVPLAAEYPDTGRRWRVRDAEGVEELERVLNEMEAAGYVLDCIDDVDGGDLHKPPTFRVFAVHYPEDEGAESGDLADA